MESSDNSSNGNEPVRSTEHHVKVTLVGKTQRGKNRVRELGSDWRVKRAVATVLFDNRPGPWLMVEPISLDGDKRQDNAARWIHSTDDVNFVVERKKD